jgi:hypothetical protein
MAILNALFLNLFSWDTLGIVSGIASVVSLLLTIFVLYDTRRIRSFYRFRARGPALMKELTTCSRKISEYLNAFEEFLPEIAEEFGRSIAKLNNLEGKVSSSQKASVRGLRKSIKACKVSAGNEETVREVHIEMVVVLEEIKQYQRDLDWEI